MAKSKKIKNMSYLPLSITQFTDVALGGYYINFFGVNGLNYFDIGDDFFESNYEDAAFQKGSNLYNDKMGVFAEAFNYDGWLSRLEVYDGAIKMISFDSNLSSNPLSSIAALSNGDILFDSQRISVNGQLGLNGQHQVGDKTLTIINGIITSIT